MIPVCGSIRIGFLLRCISVFGLKDSTAGRRQFLERLELRAREEPTRTCGAKLPERQSLQSTLRRGWYFGSQAFRERLLTLLPKGTANVRLDQEQHYACDERGQDLTGCCPKRMTFWGNLGN